MSRRDKPMKPSSHFQAIENRLNHLESLLGNGPANRSSTKRSWEHIDTPEQDKRDSVTPNVIATSDGPVTGSTGSDDPTDGMGHFVFADEEHRAYFGPSSNIAFTSDLSRALKRLSRSRGEYSPGSIQRLPDFHIARVSRPSSPLPDAVPSTASGHQDDTPVSSIFYLPPDEETSALIDQYFSNTGLLFPYLHEETFRESYKKLKQNHAATRRTWLGVLNMVLAMATHTTVLPVGESEKRQIRSEAFYRRADSLCAEYVMNGASLEIVQYLLLVSQYMQGTRSSIQTWATHGLAVKVALQLGLHSSETSKRFPPVEREIRKRTWFCCIVLDRSLSMTFGRPASIPDCYSRLELPIYFDSIEPRERQIEARRRCRYSTDFFNATIRLYSIMGKAIECLYDSNLGVDDKIPNYELITSVLRMRHSLEAWVEQLPTHMRLIQSQNCLAQLGRDPSIDRSRTILTLQYHNIKLLVHRVVLVRLCDCLDDLDAQGHDSLCLRDISWSTVHIALESATEIINIVRTFVESAGVRRALLCPWWFSLYYKSCKQPQPTAHDTDYLSIPKHNHLDNHNDNSVADKEVVDPNLSFLDFNFMTNELFDVTDGLLPNRGYNLEFHL
ncbi:hypothetical protein UA08_09423 [Talaromyces atroroseus]|uniref:Xylanolytic transcriptional activator regulatory domain-containing protein n=1 Tax=Talaromyces atroroseus TaxID=1441469 RepID=A0A1Q5Q665_TALAT|nr:hypothetical protein UA08_09423 [Talaromyces atroroseus]OKL55356.1 hypothetical protein UA08_09423 [Talaromyces atroroseus]